MNTKSYVEDQTKIKDSYAFHDTTFTNINQIIIASLFTDYFETETNEFRLKQIQKNINYIQKTYDATQHW